MGSFRFALSALLVLAPAPVLAQATNDGAPVFSLPPGQSPRPTGPEREGPEIDVPRDTPQPATTPPTDPPAVVAPTVTPTPAPPAAMPSRQTPSRAERPDPSPAREAEPAAVTQAPAEPEPTPVATPAPRPAEPAPVPTPTPAPPVVETPQPARDGGPSPWVIAGLLVLGGAVAAWFLSRRRRPAEEAPAPRPVAQLAPPPSPVPPRPAPPPPLPADRPRIVVDMQVSQARLSLVGLTIGYALTIRNEGEAVAEDIFVRGLLTGAGAAQQAVLSRFFTREEGQALHSVVALAPGEACHLTGELRLPSVEVGTVEMGGRAVLVPLLAFDVDYQWGGAQANGRTGRAFIVGEERDPPTDRLAPLRIDLGPRQYRAAACRPTALELTR